MQKNDHGIRTSRQVRRIVNGRAQLHWSGKVRRLKRSISEVILFASHGQWPRCSRVLRKRDASPGADEQQKRHATRADVVFGAGGHWFSPSRFNWSCCENLTRVFLSSPYE